MIRGAFHGDHIKTFLPRTSYLSDRSEQPYPFQQNIRRPRQRLKPPKPPTHHLARAPLK